MPLRARGYIALTTVKDRDRFLAGSAASQNAPWNY
eukprot:gene12545-3678_t